MRRALCLAMVVMVMSVFSMPHARAEFNPAGYEAVTQAGLIKDVDENVGRKIRISDPFKFCGSDFCVQNKKVKIKTRDYYCFALGAPSVVRMYIKKTHPDVPQITNAKPGDAVTAYGVFESAGGGFNYLVVDHVVVTAKKK